MSSQPRAPTKQIRSHIVDPRRPITGSVYGNGARGDLKPVASPAAPPSATDHRSRDGPPEGTLPGCSSCAEPDCPPRSPDAGTTCRRAITKPCTYSSVGRPGPPHGRVRQGRPHPRHDGLGLMQDKPLNLRADVPE